MATSTKTKMEYEVIEARESIGGDTWRVEAIEELPEAQRRQDAADGEGLATRSPELASDECGCRRER